MTKSFSVIVRWCPGDTHHVEIVQNALIIHTNAQMRGLEAAGPAHASPVIRLGHEHLRMSVHTRNQAQTNRPSDSLCHFALVARSQAGVFVVLDLAHFCHVFGHDAEVLQDVH
jgi:hypothetical protein